MLFNITFNNHRQILPLRKSHTPTFLSTFLHTHWNPLQWFSQNIPHWYFQPLFHFPFKREKERMHSTHSLNCSPYHGPINLRIRPSPSPPPPPSRDCHAGKRSCPYFRAPSDETQMKYPFSETEFTNVGYTLPRVYPFPSPPLVMNFPCFRRP